MMTESFGQFVLATAKVVTQRLIIVACSSWFTTNAVDWVERENQSNQAMHAELWPESHLERLLAERPDLIAEFKLR